MSNVFKRIFAENKFIYAASLTGFLILCIILLFPVEFSGYRTSDISVPFWYVITMSGGVAGSSIIFAVISVYLLYHNKKFPAKKSRLLIFLLTAVLIQIILSFVMRNYAKEFFRSPRPSHKYMMEKKIISVSENEFFNLTIEERRKHIESNLSLNRNKLSEVNPLILERWVYDAEFSFPSGHAFTGFYLGVIMSFVIYRTTGNRKKYFSLIPLIWGILVSLSRVIIGVHYPVDVAAGAFAGMLAGFAVISVEFVLELKGFRIIIKSVLASLIILNNS